MALKLLLISSLSATDVELGLARIANARVGRFGPLHAEPAFNETLHMLPNRMLIFTIVTAHNLAHLSSSTVTRLLSAGSHASNDPLVAITLGSSARATCDGLRSKQLICVKGTHLDSEDSGLDRRDLEASLELAVAHYALNAISLDRTVLYLDLSRVQNNKWTPSLLAGSSDGSYSLNADSVDVSYLIAGSCSNNGSSEDETGRRLAVLHVLPTSSSSRCLYDWMVYIWLKRKKDITTECFSKVVPSCLSDVDGRSKALTTIAANDHCLP